MFDLFKINQDAKGINLNAEKIDRRFFMRVNESAQLSNCEGRA